MLEVSHRTEAETTGEFFDRLKNMEPGAELGAMLEGLDRSQVNGHHLVTVMVAEDRQASHYQAQKFATMAEIAYSEPGNADSPPLRTDSVDIEFGSCEVALALCLTRRGADDQMAMALELRDRVPKLAESLDRGRIDLYRARQILRGTCHLSDEDARGVTERIIDEAEGWTSGQLRHHLSRIVAKEFPDRGKEEYEQGVEDRSVKAYPNPDGTANLVASSLPGDKVAAMVRKLTQLAKTARTPDDPRDIDQRRADVFTDLLLNDTDTGGTDRSVVDLRVDLATLLELSDTPGEIPGWGPVLADIARQIAAENHDGEWRFTATHPDTGAVLANGTTRKRPTVKQRRWVEALRPTCIFPGCRMPARDSDIDHTKSRADDGHTVVCNLAPLCRYHHRLKHETPWQLRRVDEDYVWTSPLGHTYTTSGQSP